MAMRRIADEARVAAPAEDPDRDGLLSYLHTLYRVAHAPVASHWCTPGHNRGRALADDAPPPPALLSFPVARVEEAR